MHGTRPLTPSDSTPARVSQDADNEQERQEYLEETHIESSQYGVGRPAEDEKPSDK